MTSVNVTWARMAPVRTCIVLRSGPGGNKPRKEKEKKSTWYILIVPDIMSLSLREAEDAGLYTWHVFNPFMVLGVLTSSQCPRALTNQSHSPNLCAPHLSAVIGWWDHFALWTASTSTSNSAVFLSFIGRSFWGYADWKIAMDRHAKPVVSFLCHCIAHSLGRKTKMAYLTCLTMTLPVQGHTRISYSHFPSKEETGR